MDSGTSPHMMSKSDLAPVEQDTIRKSKDTSVILTANGTTHATTRSNSFLSAIWTCLFRFNCSKNHPQHFDWGNCVRKTGSRMSGIKVSHHNSSKTGRNIECKTDNHIPSVVPGVQATGHQTEALGGWNQTRAVFDHTRQVERDLPEWLQPFTEG